MLTLGATTRVMAILNVTPDSFSDGGLYAGHEAAIQHGLQLLDEGADILDIGGESTRPNATPVSLEDELARVLPVIEAVRRGRPQAMLSVDTMKAEVAKAAVEAGADIVNDVSGFHWDPAMAAACARLGCGVVAMHTRGRPQEWQHLPPLAPEQVLPLVEAGLRASLAMAREAGVREEAIVLDPGFGFGKRGDENYVLLGGMPALARLGRPILAGVSRKSFLKPSGDLRDATTAAIAATVLAGAHIVRVHSVAQAKAAVQIADAILRAV
jgi:dihydropteroate synthase